MTLSYQIVEASEEESAFVARRLAAYNGTQLPIAQKVDPIDMNYVIKENNNVIAGINASLYHWGLMYISELFVDENHRGKDIGSLLLTHMEQKAKDRGIIHSHCDTFDFQAKDFYLKHGYSVFGVIENCPPNHQLYYLNKIIGSIEKFQPNGAI